ncbi:MAG: hypothetical protein JW712_04215 [Dehalococcoidales bacterium]|nr:hypothetical protein [Dehalococcoidales bacterium]
MKKRILLVAGALLLFTGLLPGCGGDETQPAEPAVVSEEISWPIGDTTVYATITRPESGKDYPAIVFVAGSGPTNRDWNSPLIPGSNGSAAILAEELVGRGYVTIRYDKRFTGVHAEENLTQMIGKISMQSHYEELKGAVDILAERDDVDSSRIFALASSEGCLHAVNYQLQTQENRLAGMILTGAPGQSMADLMHAQISAQLTGYPGAEEVMKRYDEAVAEFVADGTMNADESLPEGIRTLLQSLASPANLPFTREMLTIDIADDLKSLDVPVLVIIGKKDIQVDWEVDGGKLQAAAQGEDSIEFAFPENANHVLKYEARQKEEIISSGDVMYNDADSILDNDTLGIIVRWLEANAK